MGLYNELGWRDNVAQFVHSSAVGLAEPTFTDVGNGLYAYEFTNNESLIVKHHINHDVKVGGDTFMHVHWAPTTTMSIGQTITWRIQYNISKSHHQGDSILASTTTVDLTYTADGTELAGEHMILEATAAIITPEPDSIIISKATYLTGSYTTPIYGFFLDAHYEVDRNATPNRVPNFYN